MVPVHHVDAPELVLELEHLENDGDNPRVGGERIAVEGKVRRHCCSKRSKRIRTGNPADNVIKCPYVSSFIAMDSPVSEEEDG